MIKHKILIIRLVVPFLFLIGAFYAIVGIAHLSDEGWMATLEALGGYSNVRMQSWIDTIAGTILALGSIIIFIVTFFISKKPRSNNIEHN